MVHFFPSEKKMFKTKLHYVTIMKDFQKNQLAESLKSYLIFDHFLTKIQ